MKKEILSSKQNVEKKSTSGKIKLQKYDFI